METKFSHTVLALNNQNSNYKVVWEIRICLPHPHKCKVILKLFQQSRDTERTEKHDSGKPERQANNQANKSSTQQGIWSHFQWEGLGLKTVIKAQTAVRISAEEVKVRVSRCYS